MFYPRLITHAATGDHASTFYPQMPSCLSFLPGTVPVSKPAPRFDLQLDEGLPPAPFLAPVMKQRESKEMRGRRAGCGGSNEGLSLTPFIAPAMEERQRSKGSTAAVPFIAADTRGLCVAVRRPGCGCRRRPTPRAACPSPTPPPIAAPLLRPLQCRLPAHRCRDALHRQLPLHPCCHSSL